MAGKTDKSPTSRPKKKTRKWSAAVMKRSDALDLERGVFTQPSARGIAASLKRSAMASRRRKGTPFQSAMSMLNFHINRAGKSLTAAQRARLERAKEELRRLFGKTRPGKQRPHSQSGKNRPTRSRRKRS
jgi:hypothetical protein